jgi:hypothetical protein
MLIFFNGPPGDEPEDSDIPSLTQPKRSILRLQVPTDKAIRRRAMSRQVGHNMHHVLANQPGIPIRIKHDNDICTGEIQPETASFYRQEHNALDLMTHYKLARGVADYFQSDQQHSLLAQC